MSILPSSSSSNVDELSSNIGGPFGAILSLLFSAREIVEIEEACELALGEFSRFWRGQGDGGGAKDASSFSPSGMVRGNR
eukprot:scaffold19179_cov76-Amphora_coffeaeformis.AAC.1